MSLVPAVALVAATMVAGVSAIADGALLSADADADDDPRVRRAVADRESLHRTLAFARVAGQLAAGTCAAYVAGFGPTDDGADVLRVAGLALLVVLVGEAVARALGDAMGPRALRVLLPVAWTLGIVLAPVTAVAGRLDHALQRALPRSPRDDEEREAAEEQFREVIAAEAEVSREEEALMQRVFALGETQVRDIMVPRVDVVAIDREAPWNEVVDRVRSSEHARLPVFAESVDDVVGVLYAKDLLPTLVAEGEEPAGGWTTLVRPALFIPGTKTIRDQLREFRATGNHLAIVADEYGGTAGLVTIEDVLEEIVGDIRDEHDDVEEPELVREGDRCLWVAGRVSLDTLSDALDHRFDVEEVTTVGGLVYTHLGRVPRPGEQFVLDGFRVVVERVVRRRIERVYFERVAPDATADEEADA